MNPPSLRETAGFARPARRELIAASLLGAGAIGAGIGLLAVSAWLISRAAQHPTEDALALGIVAVQFFGLSKGILRYGQRLVSHDAAFRALADLRVTVYQRLEVLAPAALPAIRSGDLMARFVHDVESLQDLIVRVICPFAVAILSGTVAVVVVWLILPAAGAVLLIALLLAGTALPWLTGWLAHRSEAQQAAIRGELAGAIVDLVNGAPELAAYGATERQLERATAIDRRLGLIANRSARTAGVGQGLATLLPAVAMVGAVILGVAAVRAGHLDAVMLAVIAIVPLAAFELATGLPGATQTGARVRNSLGRTRDVLRTHPVVVDPPDPKSLPAAPAALQVRGLRCRRGEEGPWVLDGVDLDLSPGRRVAVVGRSGAGKLTLADVLLRFLPYEAGSVTLGGVELAELRGDDCRRLIGLVAQDAHIFNATLEDNLRVARRDATDEQLDRALTRVHLLDWVESLPDGLRTEVGEFGSSMSGGQRQRLAAARALLAEFPVLVLDEPGEHLDTATADAIVADVLDASSGQAILLITHRLAGLDALDEVLVLDDGRVTERGSHAALLSSNGAYADMWRREAGEL